MAGAAEYSSLPRSLDIHLRERHPCPRDLSENKPPKTAITSLHHGAKSACHGYQRNPLILSLFLLMPAKNRTTVGVRFRRRSRLASTALLGLAPVRSARALPPTTEETSALASLMTWVKQTVK
jgi:hypothetical protein